MIEPKVLYEDNHLLVVVKPPMVPVQADDSGDMDLLSLCKGYIKKKYAKPGAVYLGLVHRLDRPVGGVMVFARTSKAAARLQAAMQRGDWRKEYVAVLVQGADGVDLPQQGSLEDWMAREGGGHGSRICSEGSPGAKRALLDYSLLSQRDTLHLARIHLRTGRHHQIRLQFAARGWPIWGDARYNPASRPGQDIALWAQRLAFSHPVGGEQMVFFQAPPDKAPWNAFPPLK